MELDPADDAPVASWLYDGLQPLKHATTATAGWVNGSSYKSWRLPVEVLASLHRLSNQLLSDIPDANYFYLFDKPSFFTAK